MLTVEVWAGIGRLHFAEELGKQTIAKRLGIARNTVKTALASSDPPTYRRAKRPSVVDSYEPAIRELLKDCNTMSATVIVERIGWGRGITILKERVAAFRPLSRAVSTEKASKGKGYVYKYGEWLMFALFRNLPTYKYTEDVLRAESKLAAKLESDGYTVWGGRTLSQRNSATPRVAGPTSWASSNLL